jgi:hypothetical protein
MSKEFVFDVASPRAIATRVRVENLRIQLNGSVVVSLSFIDNNGVSIDSKSVSVPKTQANNFFNNFSAAGGGVDAFIASILEGMVTLGEIGAGNVVDF